MVHGGSKSVWFGGRQMLAAGFGLVVFLALTAVSGPADFIPQQQHPKSRPTKISKTPPPAIKIESTPDGGDTSLISVTETETAGAELLHEALPAPAAVTIGIAPDALIAKPKVRTLWVEVTAYCACKKCCGPGAKGLTSSGRPITYDGGHFLAADLKLLPYGTRLIVPGYNNDTPVEVIDRGGAIRGYHIDIFMPTHQQAVEWGKKRVQVVVVD